MFQVSGTASTSTGSARRSCTGDDRKVDRITSSPELSRSAATAASSAAEPLQTATPCLRPTRTVRGNPPRIDAVSQIFFLVTVKQ
jgi:hypothetical protein